MTRAARAVIDLAALRHNYHQARIADPGAKQYAVIKANAYGHGMVPVAQALPEADGFAVASVDEALELRGAGIQQPILLLEGFFQDDELKTILQHNLDIVLHHSSQLTALEQATKHFELENPASKSLRAWLKVDTGMHRLGFAPEEVEAAWQRLKACSLVDNDICLMTHLANADDLEDDATRRQLELFAAILPDTNATRSIANSAGILGWPESQSDIDRPGIMLYGASPFLHETGEVRGLQPVMTLKSELIAINHCRQGDALGYGGSWICPQDMPVGVVGLGYGDGYPRHAPSGTPLLVNGQRAPLVGRISMDMISVDLRELPEARVGDPVVLWGPGLPAEEIAQAAGTIAYELFCNIAPRVPREYI